MFVWFVQSFGFKILVTTTFQAKTGNLCILHVYLDDSSILGTKMHTFSKWTFLKQPPLPCLCKNMKEDLLKTVPSCKFIVRVRDVSIKGKRHKLFEISY